MLANYKCQRAAALPLLRIVSANPVLARYYYYKNDDDDGAVEGAAQTFYACCLNCTPPSGCSPGCYDARKYGHQLPSNNVCPPFPVLNSIPTGVFRCTQGEQLGPQGQASKCCAYLNPEFFSFHHMSYYDFHYALRQFRNDSPKTGRKP